MRRIATVTAVAGSLALAGCAAADKVEHGPASETVGETVGLPCELDQPTSSCTDQLTKLVLLAHDSMDQLSAPSDDQLSARAAMGAFSKRWSEECRDVSVRLGDDLDCVTVAEDITSAALRIDPTLNK